MAPYRQSDTSPVLERLRVGNYEKKKTNQAELSLLFPQAHNESQGTNLPTVAITPSKRGTHPLLKLRKLLTQTRWHNRRDKDTLVPEGTPCLNCIKISKQLRKTCHSLPSVTRDALRTRTSHVFFPLHAFPGTTCPRQCGSSMRLSPPPSLERRGRLCRRIQVAR